MNYTSRHRTVTKLVVGSMGIASIFGVNTMVFILAQNEMIRRAKNHVELQALQGQMIVDNVALLRQAEDIYIARCAGAYDQSSCELAVQFLIAQRNRAMAWADQLRDQPRSADRKTALLAIDQALNNIDSFQESISTSNITTYQQILDDVKLAVSKSQKLVEKEYKHIISSLLLMQQSILSWVNHEIQITPSLVEAKRRADVAYTFLIIVELLLFASVGSIDIWNNNYRRRNKSTQGKPEI